MPDLTIRSNENSDHLVLAADDNDHWRATLTFGEMIAAVRFYQPATDSLRVYFAEMAEAWRGWDEERVWSSRGGDCRLAAVHDGLGSIGLKVRSTCSSSALAAI